MLISSPRFCGEVKQSSRSAVLCWPANSLLVPLCSIADICKAASQLHDLQAALPCKCAALVPALTPGPGDRARALGTLLTAARGALADGGLGGGPGMSSMAANEWQTPSTAC